MNRTLACYFEMIDDFFGSIKHYLGKDEESHIDLGQKMASYPLISDLIIDAIDEIDIEINKFWQQNAKLVADYTKNRSTLKCLYSGSITPYILESFVKRSALYIDTIILPDPLFNLAVLQKRFVSNKKYYLNKLITHVFNIWKLKDLILADTDEKILIILPTSLQTIDPKEKKKLLRVASQKFIEYINELFGHNLDKQSRVDDFLKTFSNTKDIYNAIKSPALLPNEFREFKSFDAGMRDFISTSEYTSLKDDTVGGNLGLYLNSQFIRVQEHKFFCQKLIAGPIYDHELAWFFFNYEMGGLDMDAAIANALQKEHFSWVSKVPIHALKILREENELDYMRSVLRTGITDLKAKHDQDLSTICSQIEKNFTEAFQKQDSELKQLREKVEKITRKEIPITTGGFLAGFIPYVGNVVSLLSAGRDMKQHLQEKEITEEIIQDKETNLINLLMKSYEN
ncbi:MAG: hypothetical protein ACE5IW_11585 [bacterium]